MNFVEAAIALLEEKQGPLEAEELCRLALERGLIDKPGASPLRSMRGRLTSELNRGSDSRLIRLEDDRWTLAAGGGAATPGSGIADADDGELADATGTGDREHEDQHAEAESDDQDQADADDDDDDDLDDDDDDLDDDGDADDDDRTVEPGAAEAERVAPAPEVELADDDDEDADDEADDDDELEPPRDLTPEEAEVHAIYGDESQGTTPAGGLAEYRDHQTADEDRPMLPEILPERRRHRDDKRRERQRDRDARRDTRRGDRDGGPRGPGGSPSAPAMASVPVAPRLASGDAPVGEPGDELALAADASLADRAAHVLASIKGGQPVPVRQLAQMMKKRRLVEDEPEKVWRPLKAALLHDQQRRQASGLVPRVMYRGRDLFAYRGPGGALEAAELKLEHAMTAIAEATHVALQRRVGQLQLGAFEQLAHLYLTAAGYHGIDWIKRVDRSTYAVAYEAGSREPILVGVRAGDHPVDRRGVGELRAGVQAKNAARGLLLAARDLSDDAVAELGRPGKPLAVLAGQALAAALVRVGVGVQVRSVPIGFLDGDLFDRLGDV